MFASLSPDVSRFKDDHDDSTTTSPSSPSDSGPTEIRPTPQDEGVMMTLSEIESICQKLRDVVPMEPVRNVDMVEAVLRPSLIASRTKVLRELI